MSIYSRLPPLNALRAFEAAARLGGFAKAAEELNVTAAAVSHQVKALEEIIGQPLFERHARGLDITEAGRAAQPLIAEGLDRFVAGVARMREGSRRGRLLVSVTMSFGIWLVARIDRFRQRHPGLEPLIDAADRVADLDRGDADIGIRFGGGNYPGFYKCHLLSLREFPVCSPEYLKSAPPLNVPADILKHKLIHIDWWGQEDPYPTWKMWLRAAGVRGKYVRSGPTFSSGVMACKAAIESGGLVLATQLIVDEDIKAGRLVQPFDIEIGLPEGFGHYFVCAERRQNDPEIIAFRDWLLEELADSFPERSEPAGNGEGI